MHRHPPRIVLLCLLLICAVSPAWALENEQGYKTATDVAYRIGDDLTPYMAERCKLDVYYPTGVKDFATVVWFHGGGLTGGSRFIPEALKRHGIAVVAVDYRLSPRVNAPAYIEDAAAAVAWTVKHIAEFGGDPGKVFVSGHSAGGYLAAMVTLDKHYLAAHDIDANHLAGVVPFSGHTITHFTVRQERGIERTQPVVDELAPLYHVRADAPPMLLITGDREMELLGRYEENAYLWRMMKGAGHEETELYELDGYDHGGMPDGAYPLLLRFIERTLREREAG